MKNEKGAVWIGILIIMVFLTAIGLSASAAMSMNLKTLKRQEGVQVAQALAEAGIEKTIWRLNKGDAYSGGLDTLATGQVETTVTDIGTGNDIKEIVAVGYFPAKAGYIKKRTVRARITADLNGSGVAFHYGVQAGPLGITMSNNAKIYGSVYTEGGIQGGNGSFIAGSAFVSGNQNEIENVDIGLNPPDPNLPTPFAWAYHIEQLQVYGNARAINSGGFTGTTVHGTKSYGPQPPTLAMPVSDSTIGVWEGWAAEGTQYGGLTISANQDLGPAKISGNLVIDGGVTVTLKGPIWVLGDITIGNGAIIKLDSGFGNNSTMIIADKPGYRNSAGKITVYNNAKICGSYAMSYCTANTVPTQAQDPAHYNSYVMLISTKNATTIANPAIIASNNARAAVYYTTTGMLEVSNNAHLRAMTGGGIHLSNGAEVNYDTGLVNANFTSGPGTGAWVLSEWQIIP